MTNDEKKYFFVGFAMRLDEDSETLEWVLRVNDVDADTAPLEECKALVYDYVTYLPGGPSFDMDRLAKEVAKYNEAISSLKSGELTTVAAWFEMIEEYGWERQVDRYGSVMSISKEIEGEVRWVEAAWFSLFWGLMILPDSLVATLAMLEDMR